MASSSEQFTPITKAVIPVAGLGTRFLPATRIIPKPLLPILNVPVIEYAIREVVAAGITDVALVMSPGMEAVSEYFGHQEVLERELRDRGRDELLTNQLEIADLANVTVVYQNVPKGPGHAVLQARKFCDGEAFVLVFPDDVIFGPMSATEQLMQVYRKQGGSVIAVLPADEDDIPKKGIVGGGELDANGVMAVSELVEKPALEDAPSNQAIVARYVLDNRVFDYLVEERAGAGGEIQITDAIESLLGKSPVHARQLEGFHADTGNPQGMLDAAVYVESRNNPTSAARLKSIIDS